MERVALLNWTNINQDHDISTLYDTLGTPGVISWLQVTSWQVAVGAAWVEVTRDGETFYVLYQNTAAVTIVTTWTKKVWIWIDQTKVDDGSSNLADGTGIGSIQTWASYPASNYIPLASITWWVITDDRTWAWLKWLHVKWQIRQTRVQVASASTVDLWTLWGNLVDITGTTTITSFWTPGNLLGNAIIFLKFSWALTLTHGVNLILPWSANITTAAWDIAIATYEESGVWRVLYEKVDGTSVVPPIAITDRLKKIFTFAESINAWEPFFIWNWLNWTTSWQIYKCDCTVEYKSTCHWFTEETKTGWQTGYWTLIGVTGNQSWLTPWERYFLWAKTVDAWETIGNTTTTWWVDISFGNNTNYTIIQNFPITKDLLNTLIVPLKKAWSPTDTVYAGICDTVWNVLAVSLNSVTWATLTTSFQNITFNFDYVYVSHLKNPANTLYVCLFRDGAQDAVNFYTSYEQSTSYITTGQRYNITTVWLTTVSTSDLKWQINLANQATAWWLRRMPWKYWESICTAVSATEVNVSEETYNRRQFNTTTNFNLASTNFTTLQHDLWKFPKKIFATMTSNNSALSSDGFWWWLTKVFSTYYAWTWGIVDAYFLSFLPGWVTSNASIIIGVTKSKVLIVTFDNWALANNVYLSFNIEA